MENPDQYHSHFHEWTENDNTLAQQMASKLQINRSVIMPTDTVYMVLCNALNPDAIQNMYNICRVPAETNLCIYALSWHMAQLFVDMTRVNKPIVEAIIKQCWPGPLTLSLPKNNLSKSLMFGDSDLVSIRIPGDKVSQKILLASGLPLAGLPAFHLSHYVYPLSCTCAEQVRFYYKNYGVDIVTQELPCQYGIESTELQMIDDKIRFVRRGSCSIEKVLSCLPDDVKRNVQYEWKATERICQFKHPSVQPKTIQFFQWLSLDMGQIPTKVKQGCMEYLDNSLIIDYGKRCLPIRWKATGYVDLSPSCNPEEAIYNLSNVMFQVDITDDIHRVLIYDFFSLLADQHLHGPFATIRDVFRRIVKTETLFLPWDCFTDDEENEINDFSIRRPSVNADELTQENYFEEEEE